VALNRVYFHGFMGCPRDFSRIRKVLPGHALRLPYPDAHVVDFMGYVAQIRSTMGALLPKSQEWIGYSLGGRIALALAIAAPESMRSLTLIGAHPGLANEEERRARADIDAAWARRFTEEDLTVVLRDWLAQPIFCGFKRLSPGQQRQLLRQRRRFQGPALAHWLRVTSLAKMPNWRPVLRALPFPVHWIAGGDDQKFVKMYQALQAQLPRSLFTFIPNSSHMVLLEAPEILAHVLQLWTLQ
jgi:2-succinyl-6-hydroxy-2,4-cyclohexadiene-1-carboxylate synthase